jgi:imidazole glycerol-phosphate synthase subunit HisF
MARRPFQRGGIFDGANPAVFAKAKELRNTMTEAEIVLWNYLKEGVNGVKFRRQHALGIYIADFYCHKAKLVIEVDGSIHQVEEVKKQDEQKQKDLEQSGYKVIRFTNNEVMANAADVLNKIDLTLKTCLNNNH